MTNGHMFRASLQVVTTVLPFIIHVSTDKLTSDNPYNLAAPKPPYLAAPISHRLETSLPQQIRFCSFTYHSLAW